MRGELQTIDTRTVLFTTRLFSETKTPAGFPTQECRGGYFDTPLFREEDFAGQRHRSAVVFFVRYKSNL